MVAASHEHVAAYTLWELENSPPETTCGDLGAGLLKKVNMLFDIKQSQIIFTNSTNKLKQDGYDLARFVKVPFQFSLKGGIIIEANTVCDTVKLGIDTGFTLTMLRKSLIPANMKAQTSKHGFPSLSSDTFSIGGTNFGSKPLYFIDITEELDSVD